jgi:hypothetical protein
VECSCEQGNEPSGSVKCWEVLEYLHIGGFSRRAQLHLVSYLVRRDKAGQKTKLVRVFRERQNNSRSTTLKIQTGIQSTNNNDLSTYK